MTDFRIQDEGNIILLNPVSPAAKQWVLEHIPDDAQHFGNSVVIEHSYFNDILRAIEGRFGLEAA